MGTTEILGVLLSGQLLLVVWQIYKEAREIQEKKQAKKTQNDIDTEQIRKMVFKLYRNSMKEKIVDAYRSIDEDEPELKEVLRSLKDDMECYVEAGGNSLVKEMYLHLCQYVREKKGEAYYVLLLVDSIHNS